MILDSGRLQLCKLENAAEKGRMPEQRLKPEGQSCYYGERMIGYGRQYAAKGTSEQVDLLARIHQNRSARIGMYALVTPAGPYPELEQYRIDNVQHLTDEDGQRVTDLTLRRLDELYDIHGET